MLKLNILYLIIVLVFPIVGCTNLVISKDEVLKLEPKKCIDNNNCPGDVSCSNGVCNIQYFCHNDECLENQEGTSYMAILDDYSNYDNIYQNTNSSDLILEFCQKEERINNRCLTQPCSSDSNCFSNMCFNNTCIVNDQVTTYLCDFVTDKSNKAFCSKPLQESCEKDEECYPFSCSENHFCYARKEPWLGNAMLKVSLCIIIIVVLIIIIILLIRKAKKSKNSK